MKLEVIKAELLEIQEFRSLFLQEINAQFIGNKCHDYGWADVYLFSLDGVKIGYGSVWGIDDRRDRDTIFEFFLIRSHRKFSDLVFQEFIAVSKTLYVLSQTNDLSLNAMLYRYTQGIHAESVLFEDGRQTDYTFPGIIFRKRQDADQTGEEDSDYVLVDKGEVVASGGLMFNYNYPYADIYMQVKEAFRSKGMGAFIVQELKKEAYLMKRVPAARCNISNIISEATLLKAGFRVCGFRLKGILSH